MGNVKCYSSLVCFLFLAMGLWIQADWTKRYSPSCSPASQWATPCSGWGFLQSSISWQTQGQVRDTCDIFSYSTKSIQWMNNFCTLRLNILPHNNEIILLFWLSKFRYSFVINWERWIWSVSGVSLLLFLLNRMQNWINATKYYGIDLTQRFKLNILSGFFASFCIFL